MNIFIWNSRSSQESAEEICNKLQENLGAQHQVQFGTVPPQGFDGLLINWGGAVSDRFQWDRRNFRAIMNDPWRVAPIRRDLCETANRLLAQENPDLPPIALLKGADQRTYQNLVNAFGRVFSMARPSGSRARLVASENEYREALGDGLTLAGDKALASTDLPKVRVYVVNNKVVATAKSEPVSEEQFVQNAAREVARGVGQGLGLAASANALRYAIDNMIVSPLRDYQQWVEINDLPQHVDTGALQSFQRLGVDTGCLELALVAGRYRVVNFISSPGITWLSDENKDRITQEMAQWVRDNTLTSKDILRRLVNNADDEEADEMVQLLRRQLAR